MPTGAGPALAVVIVTFQSAGTIAGALEAVVPQLRADDELVVVDNASSDATADVVRRAAPRATLVQLTRNGGFTAGCNAGARVARAPLLFFLNPDAAPLPGCLDALRATADEQPGWDAWQALVVMPGGEEVNANGGVTHFLGFGWAGDCHRPLGAVATEPSEVGFASGAALVVRRDLWAGLGGFDEDYFMYGEEVELSLRIWLAGRGVGVVPAALVEHDYEFTKGTWKWYLLERNRWRTILTTYPGALLALLAPALLAAELALLAVAARDGWLPAKLKAQAAVLRSLPSIVRRRREVQALRAVSAAEFASHLTASLESPYLDLGRLAPLTGVQAGYWWAVRRVLGVIARAPATRARS